MAQIHRFHDKMAIFLGSGETVYLNSEETRKLVNIMLECAADIENYSFQESPFKTVNFEYGSKPRTKA